ANMQARKALGAASLTTIMQMVAAGHGITLLPELCAAAEVDRQRVALIPFPDDPPMRTLGLVWRKTSGRKKDFIALGDLVKTLRQAQAAGQKTKVSGLEPGRLLTSEVLTSAAREFHALHFEAEERAHMGAEHVAGKGRHEPDPAMQAARGDA